MTELTTFLMCRAKEKDWKEKVGNTWVEGYYAKQVDGNGAEHHVFLLEEGLPLWKQVEIDPKTICRNTGAKDSSGNPIWEKDILEIDLDEKTKGYGVICFGTYASPFHSASTEHIGFYVSWRSPKCEYLRRDLGYWLNEGAIAVSTVYDHKDMVIDPNRE